MKKKTMSIIFLINLFLINFIGCVNNQNEQNNNLFIGTWIQEFNELSEIEWIFFNNDTVKITYDVNISKDFNSEQVIWTDYIIENGGLHISVKPSSNNSIYYKYSFMNNNTTLILDSDEDTISLNRIME